MPASLELNFNTQVASLLAESHMAVMVVFHQTRIVMSRQTGNQLETRVNVSINKKKLDGQGKNIVSYLCYE